MSWEDRLKTAAYISPLGFRREFEYEDVTKNFNKKTATFEFPAANGTYVQDLGYSGRRIPIRAIFSGGDCDLEALSFETELREKGIGRLEHPIYGTINVMPVGAITRSDRLKTAANQAFVEVTLWETIWEIYAGSITDLLDDILKGIDFYNEAASGQLNTEAIVDKVTESASFKNFYGSIVSSTTKGLGGIASTDSAVSTNFNAVSKSMQSDLSSEQEPDVETLGNQTAILVQLPAKTKSIELSVKSEAYNTLFNNLTKPQNINQEILYNNRVSNEFHSRDIYAGMYISGIFTSVLNTGVKIRSETIDAADNLIQMLTVWTNWRDDNYDALNKDDTGNAYRQLQELVSLTLGYLIELSFSLQTERRIVLTRARSMIDLVGELYGTIDDKLDFFIQTNNLTGSEILELPRGKEIVYFV